MLAKCLPAPRVRWRRCRRGTGIIIKASRWARSGELCAANRTVLLGAGRRIASPISIAAPDGRSTHAAASRPRERKCPLLSSCGAPRRVASRDAAGTRSRLALFWLVLRVFPDSPGRLQCPCNYHNVGPQRTPGSRRSRHSPSARRLAHRLRQQQPGRPSARSSRATVLSSVSPVRPAGGFHLT